MLREKWPDAKKSSAKAAATAKAEDVSLTSKVRTTV